MKINIADALISVVLVWILIPRYGINGYLFAVYFSEFFNTVCSITHLLSISKTTAHPFKWVYKPLFCIVLATAGARLLWSLPTLRLSTSPFSVVLHILTSLLLYAVLLRLTQGVDREDASWLFCLFTPPKERKKQRNCAEG